MDVNPEIENRSYPPMPVFEVGREKIREFAEAIGSTDPVHVDPRAARELGYPDVVAPATFPVVVAQRAEFSVIDDPDSGIDFARVVHGEERFVHHRPVHAGDRLVATPHVDRVRQAGGHWMVTTRVDIGTEEEEPVSTVYSTIVVRGERA